MRINFPQSIFGQSNIDPYRLCWPDRTWNQDRDSIKVLAVRHDGFQRRRLRDGVSIFGHSVDMEGQGFFGHASCFIKCCDG